MTRTWPGTGPDTGPSVCARPGCGHARNWHAPEVNPGHETCVAQGCTCTDFTYTAPSTREGTTMNTLGKVALGALGTIVVISVLATACGGGSTTPTTAPTTAPPATSGALPTVVQVPIDQTPPTTEAPPGPLTTFGPGTYDIGTDVAPGTYKSAGPLESVSPLCYWDTESAAGAIDGQGVTPAGPSRAVLRKGMVFTSSGCQDWHKV